MARKWTFLIKVFLEDLKGEVIEYGAFEPRAISPWKLPVGPFRDGGSIELGSQDFDHNPNPMAIANFVSNIGNKNTLSFQKLECPMTQILQEAYQKRTVLHAINFYVTPLSSISKGLKGEARFLAIFKNSMTYVTLKTVGVPLCRTKFVLKDKTQDTGEIQYAWNYVTFEAKEVGKFQFKGTDW